MINNLLVSRGMYRYVYLLLFFFTHCSVDRLMIIITNHQGIMLKLIALGLMFTLLGALEVRIISNDMGVSSGRMEEVNSVKLTINSNGKYIYPHHQNTFKLPQLPVGRSFVQVISTYHVYPLMMIDTKSTGESSVNLVHPFTRVIIEHTGEPIYIKPIDRLQYLFEEQSFSIATFLTSGTGLFLLFGVGMYLCYSKLMPTLQEAQMAPESAQPRRQQ